MPHFSYKKYLIRQYPNINDFKNTAKFCTIGKFFDKLTDFNY